MRLAVDGDEVAERPSAAWRPGKEREVRFDDVRSKKGERKLTATVDPENAVAESNEDNNELKVTVALQGRQLTRPDRRRHEYRRATDSSWARMPYSCQMRDMLAAAFAAHEAPRALRIAQC